jgi:hypothetical protein
VGWRWTAAWAVLLGCRGGLDLGLLLGCHGQVSQGKVFLLFSFFCFHFLFYISYLNFIFEFYLFLQIFHL